MDIEVCLIKKKKSSQLHKTATPSPKSPVIFITEWYHLTTPLYTQKYMYCGSGDVKLLLSFSPGLCSRNNTETCSGSGSNLSYFKPELYVWRKMFCFSKCTVMATVPHGNSFKLPFPDIFVELWYYSSSDIDIWISSAMAHITHLSIWLLWWTLLMSADCIWWTD